MNKQFLRAATVMTGALFAHAPVEKIESPAVHARYYFASLTRLARSIQTTGVMKFVAIGDGNVNFTDKNTSGIKPSDDAKLVHFHFGLPPIETAYVVNREAHAMHISSNSKLSNLNSTGPKDAERSNVTTVDPRIPHPSSTLG